MWRNSCGTSARRSRRSGSSSWPSAPTRTTREPWLRWASRSLWRARPRRPIRCNSRSPRWRRRRPHCRNGPWARPAARHAYGVAFRRGFVEEITLNAPTLLEHGEEIFAVVPVRLLRVIGAAHVLDRFVRCPQLARIEALHLTGSGLGDAGAV